MSGGGARGSSSPLRQMWLIVKVGFRSSFRKNWRSRILYHVSLLVVLIPMSIWVGWLAARAAAEPEYRAGEALLLGIFAAGLFFKGLLTGGESLDSPKLFLYPVSHGTVFAAQLLSHALSPSLAVFLALFLGYARSAPGAPLEVALRALVVLGFLAHLHLVSLLFQLLLANLLRLRRWRDAGTVLGSLLAVGVYLAMQLLRQPGVREEAKRIFEKAAPFLAALPSSWAARALHPGTPHYLALLYLLCLSGVTLALGALASHLQRLAFYGEITFSSSGGKRSAGQLGRAWRWRSVPTEIGAVAAKDLHTLRRDPLVKDILIRQVGIVLVPLIAIFFIGTDAPREPMVVVLVILYTLLLGETLILFNLFALDGPGVVALFSTPAPRWKILLGKDLAALIVFAPLNVGLCVAGLIVLGAPRHIPFAAAVGTSSIASVLAVGNFAATAIPFQLLARRRIALGSEPATTGGCLIWLARLVLMATGVTLSTPVGLLVGAPLVLEGPWTYSLTLPAAGLYIILLLAVTLPAAGRNLERREESLLATFAWKK